MPDFDNLDLFTLRSHGDRHERERWRFLSQSFSSYEVFWRRFVVPLTNRVNPTISHFDSARWIRLRPGIPAKFEKLAVSHYSVFYYLSRAVERTHNDVSREFSSERPVHPEDTFFLLETCAENALHFFDSLRDIVADYGFALPYLPSQHPRDFPRCFLEVSCYRNLLLHNPVLGRKMDHDATFLPKIPKTAKTRLDMEASLTPYKFSWSAIDKARTRGMIRIDQLLPDLEKEIMKFFELTWQKIIGDFARITEHDKYLRVLRLAELLPIAAPASDHLCLAQPIGASGVQVDRVQETNRHSRNRDQRLTEK